MWLHSLKGKTSKGIAISFGKAIIIGSIAGVLPVTILLPKLFISFLPQSFY